ncbi:uncharacterized protein CTRU02_211611 [Colletotrichum truncatum]|uniref:Uncharacterized protein n=1 Tax=Colletotrichum truncatum TaxID=5467 RepID=A0ACC3YL69_COLTU|nr:uncharacterized protein CTRU02_14119 [Colletotrichum truncatum]KAF6782638.1 hypothetical protein CTRU02_14119 [Colletotrichum truncatum]
MSGRVQKSKSSSASTLRRRNRALRIAEFGLVVDMPFDRLLDEAARLEDAEVAEEEVLRKKAAALRAAQAELDESMARLDRLRKQKRMVFRKGREVTEEEPVAFTADWDTLYPDVALSPSLLAEFGLLDSGSVVKRRSTPEASPGGVGGP